MAYEPVFPDWHVKGGATSLSSSFLVAGIVNITPDSFSDGGTCFTTDAALARIRQHLAEGAHLLDLGAESTRPGAESIGSEEECGRLMPVLHALASAADLPSHTLCVDTFRADTARQALLQGVQVINDVSGGVFEPAILDVTAEHKAGFVIGHSPRRPDVMQDNPRYEKNIIEILLDHFTRQMETLIRKGLPETHMVLDPCIGFGKNLEHTLAIFDGIPRLLALGRPLYFGISRKSFLGSLTGLPTRERGCQTQVATALLAQKGVCIHRVHEVKETLATLALVQAMHTP